MFFHSVDLSYSVNSREQFDRLDAKKIKPVTNKGKIEIWREIGKTIKTQLRLFNMIVCLRLNGTEII